MVLGNLRELENKRAVPDGTRDAGTDNAGELSTNSRFKPGLFSLIRLRLNFLNRFLARISGLYNARILSGLVTLIVVLAYFIFQGSLIFSPLLERALPAEVDDTYTYIVKSAQLTQDPFQKSAAIDSLRQQLLAPSDVPEVKWLRYKEYVRGFVMYHPLYSLLLTGGHGLGLSWESAYSVISVLGFFGLALGVFYFITSLVGWPAALGGIVFLFAEIFPGAQGLHFVIPSTLSLALALFAWGLVLRSGTSRPVLVILLTLAMVAMHPMGRVYGGVLVLLVLALKFPKIDRPALLVFSLGSIIVGLGFILPYIISAPDLKIASDPAPQGWNYLAGLYTNLYVVKEQLLALLSRYGVSSLILVGLGLGVASLSQLRKLASIFLLLSLVCGLGVVHALPRYPADLSLRSMAPLILVIAAVIGLAMLFLVRALITTLLLMVRGGWFKHLKHWQLNTAIFSLAGILVLPGVISKLRQDLESHLAKRADLVNRYAYEFDSNQIDLLKKRLTAGDQVAFLAEEPLHFYLTRSLWNTEMIYVPGIESTPLETTWIKANKKIAFVVGFNPLERFSQGEKTNTHTGLFDIKTGKRLVKEGGIEVGPLESLVLQVPAGDSFSLSGVRIMPARRGRLREMIIPTGELEIDIEASCADGSSQKFSVPTKNGDWINLTSQINCLLSRVSLKTPKQMRVTGIQNTDQSLNWPWNQGLSVQLFDGLGSPRSNTLTFDTAAFLPSLGRRLSVVSDSGSLVLLSVD